LLYRIYYNSMFVVVQCRTYGTRFLPDLFY
jgi:hypothetical protein